MYAGNIDKCCILTSEYTWSICHCRNCQLSRVRHLEYIHVHVRIPIYSRVYYTP